MRPWSRHFFTRLAAVLLLAAGSAATQAGAVTTLEAGEIASLRQELEQMGRRLQQVQDHQLLLEGRMRDQQQALDELRRTPSTENGTLPRQMTARPTAPAVPTAPAATGLYLQAFGDFAAGHFPQAVEGFNRFLQAFPDSDYAGNAQYWLAESYFNQQQYSRAAEEFATAAERYPNSAKAPEALLKLSETARKLGDTQRAGRSLQQLRSRYPESSAARSLPNTP